MELFILLILSFCCCQAKFLEGEEIDCDDPKVFKAVDLALRAYNNRREGNKFTLVQVLEARETAGPDVKHLVKYEVKETSCAVGHRSRWQECVHASVADLGMCVANVHLDTYSTVSQTCTILPAPKEDITSGAGCRGCWSPITNDSQDLLPIVRYTIRKFNSQSDHPSHFEVGKITNAQRQVVSGWRYKFEYSIKETNCSKAAFAELTPACRPIPGGRAGICKVDAYVNISDTLAYAVQDCTFQAPKKEISAGCLGCWSPLTNDSLALLPIVRYTIRKFNSQNDHPSHFEVGKITNAQRQVVSGWRYKFEYSIKETNCSKAVFAELTAACRPIPGGRAGNCEVTAYVNISNTLVYAVQDCKLQEVAPLVCLGCPRKIAIDHPDMLTALHIALEKYNNESSDSFHYKVQQITSALSQVVAGIRYLVDFTVIKTNCSKDNFQELRKTCTSVQHSNPLDCNTIIYVRPHESQTFPHVTCTKIKKVKNGNLTDYEAMPPLIQPRLSILNSQGAKIHSLFTVIDSSRTRTSCSIPSCKDNLPRVQKEPLCSGMELFILLILSFCCCQAKFLEGEEVDCNDPEVFKAVDLALRAYNDRREGNQFALVQVLEARETVSTFCAAAV
ncbi:hypothetical protein lerEdw1_016949 [Lerista edwardsae]|nr:hypothetical protein lerEdw1_016949 [Lerista edwardsae]